jgi:hypothetical protein
MSHVTTVDIDFKDQEAFIAAAEELGYRVEKNASVQLYQREANYENCVKVTIPGWAYPVAMSGGRLYYDNYNGDWGDTADVHKLQQRYARNVAIKTAKARGFRVQEKTVNGKVKLTLSRW